MEYIEFFAKAFVTIFIIVDPPGNIPLFISLTESATEKEKEAISKKATIIGLALLLVVALTGTFILDIFKITVDGLRIAGGILLFIIAADILMGNRRKRTYIESDEERTDVDAIATFPIALPLYTGPGAITAAIVLYSTAEEIPMKILVLVAIVLTYIIVRITHMYRNQILRVLGESGSNIFARLMTIFIAAIGIEYIFAGLAGKILF